MSEDVFFMGFCWIHPLVVMVHHAPRRGAPRRLSMALLLGFLVARPQASSAAIYLDGGPRDTLSRPLAHVVSGSEGGLADGMWVV